MRGDGRIAPITVFEPRITADSTLAIPEPGTASMRGDMAVFLAAFALCLAFRLPALGDLAFWFDEVITADTLNMSWQDLVADRLANGHFPFYFGLLKGLGLAGGSEFALRLPSAIFDSLAGGVVALIGRRLDGRVGSLAAALLYAMMPSLILYGQEARPYAMLLLFLTLAMFGQMTLLIRPDHGRRHAAVATIGTLGAVLTLPVGAVTIALQHIALLFSRFGPYGHKERRLWLAHIALTWIGAVIALSFLIPAVLKQAAEPVGLLKWQSKLPFSQRMIEAFGETYGFVIPHDIDRFLAGPWNGLLAAGLIALMVVGLVAHRGSLVHRYLGLLAFGTPLIFIGLGIFTASAGRYLIGMMPAAVLLAASGAGALLRLRRGGARIAVLAVLLAFAGFVALQALDTLASTRKYDWRPIAEFLATTGIRDATLYSDAPQIEKTLRHYLPPDGSIAYRTVAPDREPIDTLWQAAGSEPAGWFLLTNWRNPPDSLTDGATVCSWPFGDMKLVMVAHDAARIPPALAGCGSTSSK